MSALLQRCASYSPVYYSACVVTEWGTKGAEETRLYGEQKERGRTHADAHVAYDRW